MPETIRIALAGNPNSGKTTIFNDLTGSRQHVANYPGVTIEKREGHARRGGYSIEVTDLPGTYSLTAYSLEEKIARDFIVNDNPDLVVNVVDASNLERSLYLTVQLMELGAPLVLALNMMDIATRRGLKIDSARLSLLFGVPIVSTVGNRGEGIEELFSAVIGAYEAGAGRATEVRYGRDIEEEIERIEGELARLAGEGAATPLPQYGARWIAARLLEGDEEVVSAFTGAPAAPVTEAMGERTEAAAAVATGERPQSVAAHARVLEAVEKGRQRIRAVAGDDPEIMLADRRYGFISGACQESVISTVESRHIFSDTIDTFATHRILGIPILLGLMYAVFYAAFTLASAPGEWIGTGLEFLASAVTAAIPAQPYEALSLQSLLVDGIIGGVGSVIAFLPNVMVLFLAIAALEDTGYMARAAFVMDHLMHKMGLHGKSFIPMIIGFGCSVPAVMATRTIESRRGRLTTMMVVPLMSCGARLPVYALVIPAFFRPEWAAPVLWVIYILGIALAVALARLLRVTVLRGESHPLVMELPPYRMPTLKGLFIHTWERARMYVRKAGTVILAVSVLFWFLSHWPAVPRETLEAAGSGAAAQRLALERSVVGRVGKAMEPAVKPLGFDWRIGTGMIGATAAKEVFVAQMGIVFGVGAAEGTSTQLRHELAANYAPLSGVAMLLYMLIASPCVATVAITRRESGSWKWAALQWVGLTVVGYLVALVVFQAGSLLRLGV